MKYFLAFIISLGFAFGLMDLISAWNPFHEEGLGGLLYLYYLLPLFFLVIGVVLIIFINKIKRKMLLVLSVISLGVLVFKLKRWSILDIWLYNLFR